MLTVWFRSIATLWLVVLVAASAGAAEIEHFFGRFEGTAIAANDDGLTTRDISVTIEPRKNGFSVAWTTATPADGPRRKSYSIDFERTNRPEVFGSAMRKDMFGNRVPLNPLKGDPYVWATLYGDTLTVYSLIITEAGGYELQQYDRTLVDDGMHLDFTRIRQGRELRRVTGTLRRVKE